MDGLPLAVAGACAVVVTYHPDADALENLRAVRPQVECLVVVDNGSSAAELSMLREAGLALGFDLIENETNLGIATALNSGVRHAQALHKEWIFLFDQDSRVTDGFVSTMLDAFSNSASGDRLAILVPRYIDSRFGHVLPSQGDEGVHQQAATTSGSLTPARVFDRAGMFLDELFIDGVDYEYSLRVRSLGMVIDECPAAQLLHSPGTPSYHSLFGLKRFQVANYSPLRRYYQERNMILITRRYWRRFMPFLLGQITISLIDFIKILIAEDDKWRKCRFFFRGIIDGLRNRTGKLPEA
jgi:rhamnosyltransferase